MHRTPEARHWKIEIAGSLSSYSTIRALRPIFWHCAAISSRSSRVGATSTRCAPVTYSKTAAQAGHGHGSVRIAYHSPSEVSIPSKDSISSSVQTA